MTDYKKEYCCLLAAYNRSLQELQEQKGVNLKLEKLLQDMQAMLQVELGYLIQQGKVGSGGSGGQYKKK